MLIILKKFYKIIMSKVPNFILGPIFVLANEKNSSYNKVTERMRYMREIAVIGGGASGLVAAITAARLGSRVTIFERQNRVGKKILVTGNGRCNMTNLNIKPEYFHTSSPRGCFTPIENKNVDVVLDFFNELGIEPLVEKTKVYPASEQASSVLDVMRMEVERLGIIVKVECKVIALEYKERKWQVQVENGEKQLFDRIIVSTGGMAAPNLGCDHSGYNLLKKLGHTEIETFPTIVHIISPTPYCKMMKGMRFKAEVSILVENALKRVERGEVLFTEDGLSGPPIFLLSRVASESFKNHKPCEIHFDLMPDWSKEDLVAKLYERLANGSHKSIEDLFVGWVNKRAILAVIKEADIGSPITPCENLDYEMIERLAESMKCLVFKVEGTRGFKFAQATAGGICIDEIDLQTMASKKVPNLYVTGEVLDVDGDCGGYNLQWAWSTGLLAGESAATV